MPFNPNKPYDLFISYSRKDQNWVRGLWQSLRDRGINAWFDQDDIPPGAPFPERLKLGIEASHAFGLVITPASLASDWVKKERRIALELYQQGKIQLIPIQLAAGVEPPSEMPTHNMIDFSQSTAKYESLVDTLAWHGIVGKRVHCIAMAGEHNDDDAWNRLERVAWENDIKFDDYYDFERLKYYTDFWAQRREPPTRVVVFVDPFEQDFRDSPDVRRSVEKYLDLIREIRAKYRDVNPVRFVLYQRPGAMSQWRDALGERTMDEFAKFFTLDRTLTDDLPRAFRAMWNTVQKDLMIFERK